MAKNVPIKYLFIIWGAYILLLKKYIIISEESERSNNRSAINDTHPGFLSCLNKFYHSPDQINMLNRIQYASIKYSFIRKFIKLNSKNIIRYTINIYL